MPSTGGRLHSLDPSNRQRRVSSRRSLRVVALLGAALLTIGVLPPTVASAVIGASSSPLTTAAPDLRTVAVTTAPETRWCFDQPVANFVGNFALFHLTGYDDMVTATGTQLGVDPNSADCLLVTFNNSGSDITQYTVGYVDPGAVTNASASNMNIEGAAALGNISLGAGGIGGRLTGPDVVSAAKDVGNPSDILYTFDEKLLLTS